MINTNEDNKTQISLLTSTQPQLQPLSSQNNNQQLPQIQLQPDPLKQTISLINPINHHQLPQQPPPQQQPQQPSHLPTMIISTTTQPPPPPQTLQALQATQPQQATAAVTPQSHSKMRKRPVLLDQKKNARIAEVKLGAGRRGISNIVRFPSEKLLKIEVFPGMSEEKITRSDGKFVIIRPNEQFFVFPIVKSSLPDNEQKVWAVVSGEAYQVHWGQIRDRVYLDQPLIYQVKVSASGNARWDAQKKGTRRKETDPMATCYESFFPKGDPVWIEDCLFLDFDTQQQQQQQQQQHPQNSISLSPSSSSLSEILAPSSSTITTTTATTTSSSLPPPQQPQQTQSQQSQPHSTTSSIGNINVGVNGNISDISQQHQGNNSNDDIMSGNNNDIMSGNSILSNINICEQTSNNDNNNDLLRNENDSSIISAADVIIGGGVNDEIQSATTSQQQHHQLQQDRDPQSQQSPLSSSLHDETGKLLKAIMANISEESEMLGDMNVNGEEDDDDDEDDDSRERRRIHERILELENQLHQNETDHFFH